MKQKNNFVCEKCGNDYKTKNGLQEHYAKKHSIIAIIKQYWWVFTIIGILLGALYFYVNTKPDLQIETNNVGGINWEKLEYYFNVKNYGNSTADNVEIRLDLDYWQGQINRIKNLPPEESYKFIFYAAPQTPPTVQNTFLDNAKKISAGEKTAVGTIKLTYSWLIFPFYTEYFVSIEGNNLWVQQKN